MMLEEKDKPENPLEGIWLTNEFSQRIPPGVLFRVVRSIALELNKAFHPDNRANLRVETTRFLRQKGITTDALVRTINVAFSHLKDEDSLRRFVKEYSESFNQTPAYIIQRLKWWVKDLQRKLSSVRRNYAAILFEVHKNRLVKNPDSINRVHWRTADNPMYFQFSPRQNDIPWLKVTKEFYGGQEGSLFDLIGMLYYEKGRLTLWWIQRFWFDWKSSPFISDPSTLRESEIVCTLDSEKLQQDWLSAENIYSKIIERVYWSREEIALFPPGDKRKSALAHRYMDKELFSYLTPYISDRLTVWNLIVVLSRELNRIPAADWMPPKIKATYRYHILGKLMTDPAKFYETLAEATR